jgi:uncharacterized Zn finger protein
MGRLPAERVECPKCGCEFAFWEQKSKDLVTLRCPDCGIVGERYWDKKQKKVVTIRFCEKGRENQKGDVEPVTMLPRLQGPVTFVCPTCRKTKTFGSDEHIIHCDRCGILLCSTECWTEHQKKTVSGAQGAVTVLAF